jgi:hypothetical protein
MTKSFGKVAREVVDQHGPGAIPILQERAKGADMSDDELAAETWRDIANAAERILQARDRLKAD